MSIHIRLCCLSCGEYVLVKPRDHMTIDKDTLRCPGCAAQELANRLWLRQHGTCDICERPFDRVLGTSKYDSCQTCNVVMPICHYCGDHPQEHIEAEDRAWLR